MWRMNTGCRRSVSSEGKHAIVFHTNGGRYRRMRPVFVIRTILGKFLSAASKLLNIRLNPPYPHCPTIRHFNLELLTPRAVHQPMLFGSTRESIRVPIPADSNRGFA